MGKVCIIAQFPPPLHGLSKAVDTISKSVLESKYRFNCINITDNKRILKSIVKIIRDHSGLYYFTIAQSRLGNIRDLIIMCILMLKNKKVIIHLHGGYFKKLFDEKMGKVQRYANRILFSKVDAAIVLSESLKSLFEGIVPEHKIKIAQNCVDDEFIIDDASFNSKLDSIEKRKVLNIAYLSNFIEGKGYKDVLELAKLSCCRQKPKYKFIFAGKFYTKQDEKYFHSFIKENSLEQCIGYKGIVDGIQKKEFLNRTHIFVLPTRLEEGQPISIIEAMANGAAVITTRRGGICDLVTDGVNGFFIEPRQPKIAFEKLEALFDDRRLLGKMSLTNRNKVKAQYLQEHYISGMEKIFDEVLGV